jgi:signal transduction histidine kinase
MQNSQYNIQKKSIYIMKIRSKLFVLLVSLILTSLLAASFVSINVLSADMIRETKVHLEDDLTNSMDRISMDSYNRISDIRFLGESMNAFPPQSGADLVKKLEILKKFIANHNDYSSISIYNKTGIKIVDVKGIGIDENVSNETFFTKAVQGDIYRDSTPSNYLKSSKEKEILLSGPLYDKSGKTNEILLLSYPLDTKIVEHISTSSHSNLRINLLSDDGKIIYSNYDKSRSLSNAGAASILETLPIYPLIKDSNNRVESAIFNDTGSSSGNAIFVAAKESSNNSQNPDSIQNKWILVTSLDTQEAFKEVLSLRNMFISITVIVLAISIIGLYIVVDRIISIPITKLKNAAIAIGKGNLDTLITPPSTIDEIGELSSQFGKMRARIKTRTAELMRKDKELETTNEQLKEKESILEKANEQLKNQEKIQKEFINVAAHELRTPIQPILGLSELLQSKEENEEKYRLIETITRNAKRLHRLTEDILDISKIESQSLKLHKEQFNVNDLISNVVQDYRNQIEKDDILTLSYKSKKDINYLVEADRYRITQVISNLLNNAIKFTEEGTISVTLEKRKEENRQEVLVSIKDSGTGIHSDILPRLFSKFATKAEKGTGLGLFISRSIVEAHGGRIWGENNTDGKGARFSFTLPLLDQHK